MREAEDAALVRGGDAEPVPLVVAGADVVAVPGVGVRALPRVEDLHRQRRVAAPCQAEAEALSTASRQK